MAMTFITKIHDKYYDLTNFKHPGGDIAVSMSYGRDATELFESMHQFADRTKLQVILAKYEVQDISKIDVPIVSNNVYDWQETNTSAFTKELNEVVNQVLISSSSSSSSTVAGDDSDVKVDRISRTKISWTKILEVTSFFILTLYQYYYLVQGAAFSIITFPTALWLFTVNVFHDGSHFAVSRFPVINHLLTETALLFSTPFTWYHQHIIGHHCFPNVIGKDPDLYHSTKYIRHSKDIRHKPPHKNQIFIFPLLWVIGVPLGLILRGCLDSLAGKPYNKVVPQIPEKASHIISRTSIVPRLMAIVLIMFVLPCCYHGLTWKGLAFAVLPYLVYSCHFMICSQINHFTPESDDQVSKNFYIQQVVTGHNVAPESYLLYLYTGKSFSFLEYITTILATHLVPICSLYY